MANPVNDIRYSVNLEFTGEFKRKPKGAVQGQMWVARFGGEWLGSDVTKTKAWALCLKHKMK